MLQIQDKIVSFEIIEKCFVCDYEACKGICCVEGDSGAPLAPGEADKIRQLLPLVQDLISPRAKELINKQGVSYIDEQGDEVTSIIDGRDCVFTTYDEFGRCQCSLEKVYREGKSDFMKPISCHLYPIRTARLKVGLTALNYQKWGICKCALKKGRKLQVPIYKFLKEPLIRAYGEAWYNELCETAELYLKEKSELERSFGSDRDKESL